MTLTQPRGAQPPIQYTNQTLARAERALRCSPFREKLFDDVGQRGVPLAAIAGQTGVQNQYTQQPLPELATEGALLWLIQVGLLRREVDGQGITDSFRLTPLGHQVLSQWKARGYALPAPSVWDRLVDTFNRWLRLLSL